MHWTRLGSTCPPRLVLLCTVLCLFTMVTHLSTVYMAALQEQRVAVGTRYEVPEVSFSNSHCNTWSTSLHLFHVYTACV